MTDGDTIVSWMQAKITGAEKERYADEDSAHSVNFILLAFDAANYFKLLDTKEISLNSLISMAHEVAADNEEPSELEKFISSIRNEEWGMCPESLGELVLEIVENRKRKKHLAEVSHAMLCVAYVKGYREGTAIPDVFQSE